MDDTRLSPEERIKARARALGFDAVGITTAAPPGHADHTAAWLSAGLHGEMGYLERRADLRGGPLDDERLLAGGGVRSVIVLAVSYNVALSPPAPAGGALSAGPAGAQRPCIHAARALDRVLATPRGVVARYARGRDYHDVIRERENALGRWIETTWPGARTRGFVDSGPIRERELAARAGLGWQGKHTGLISLDLGNWFFLGALITTLELTPDPPFRETGQGHCGTCTRCLTACPTGALIAPLTMDARRCISYLTIELKGPIPRELRPLMGDHIFGCDDCLAACPWNERAQAGREARLAARSEDDAFPDLLAWLELLADEAAFRIRFAGTPLLRTRREGLRRNVCVALGNVAGPEEAGVPLARVLADDPSPVVRGHAAWALGRIAERYPGAAGTSLYAALRTALTTETDEAVRAEIQESLYSSPAAASSTSSSTSSEAASGTFVGSPNRAATSGA